MTFGIDISHHQISSKLPWNTFEGKVSFVICRAAYGGLLRDRQVADHVQRARGIGAKVGLYVFFRPSQSVDSHWDTLRAVADQVGLQSGDIVPALDIEHDPLPKPGSDVAPAWSAPCEELVNRMVATYGDALVYITQREWSMLGKPQWVLERPLWVAHYTSASQPASPGGVAPCIWQYRVGPFNPEAPGGLVKAHPDLDHNRGLRDLPLVSDCPDQDLDDLRDMAAARFADSAEAGS